MKTIQSSEIQPFQFHNVTVSVINRDGEPWFIATEAASFLGYANPQKAIRDHCKGVNEMVLPSAGGAQTTKIIPERDLYRLIMRSKMPAAQAFEEWVVAEVLPSVRKTGGYRLPSNYSEALRALADSAEEAERLRQTVQEQAPAVEFVQRYVKAEGLFGIRETARILGIAPKAFTDLCQTKGVLFREGGTLQPYAEWLEKGYFQVKTGEVNEHAYKQAKFTSKGLEWVRTRLELSKLLAMPS